MKIEELLEKHMTEDKESLEKLNEELKGLKESVNGLQETISKYKGFLGGVIFVVSAIWAVLQLFSAKLFGVH